MAGLAPKSVFPLPSTDARIVGDIATAATPVGAHVRIASARSIAGSVALHGLLLAALAFALRGHARPAEPVIEFEVGVVADPGGGEARAEATTVARDLQGLRGELSGGGGDKSGGAAPDLRSIATGSGGAVPGLPTGGQRDVIGTGSGGLGTGSGREVTGGGGVGSLWGVGSGTTPPAHSYVYVLDRSGSMQDTFPQLQVELRRAIGSLSDGQHFNVIWFSEGPSEAISPTLIAATTENKLRTFESIRGMSPKGRTQPLDALRRGLAMQPEVLYLLSDGDFGDQNEAVVGLIRDARSSGATTVIHTILFNYEAGREEAAVLRRIAEVGGGTYKQISEERLGG